MIIVLMGVSGSGKTTIGQLLSVALQIPFFDADNFHPLGNIEKMKSGIPLSDDDREPWLKSLAAELHKADTGTGCILACSALKEKYRIKLQKELKENIKWIYLHGTPELIYARLKSRSGHFMPVHLLQSQFEILEVPEDAHTVSIEHHPEFVVKKIIDHLEENI